MKALGLPAFLLLFAASAFSQDSGDIKTINKSDPVFPAEAKNYIYGEDLKVAILVDKKGKVTEARAMGPLVPCSNLEDPVAKAIRKAAVDAAKDTTFEPILKDGKPQETELMITYRLLPKGAPVAGEGNKLVRGGVLNGKAVSLPKPSYPAGARSSRAGGIVNVQILIGEDGRIISAGPLSGHPLLIDASLETACKARFTATTLGGQPVKVTGALTYNFIP